MKRVVIIYNPKSSRFVDVEKEVLQPLRHKFGDRLLQYMIDDPDLEHNIQKVSRKLNDGDLVIAAGGDATAAIVANGILKSGREVEFAVLPYGNFNDLARTLGTNTLEQVLSLARCEKMHPLDVVVDGQHFRYATCYVTIGMTAEAVEIFDDKKIRKQMQKGSKSSWRSYVQLAEWYFENRHKKTFLPHFKLNGVEMDPRISDYAAINGRSMARVMRGRDNYLDKEKFRSETGKLTNFWNLSVLMMKSILVQVPGSVTTRDVLEFFKPATVEIQAEGEYKIFKDIKKIEIRKAKQCLVVRQI